MDPLLAAQVRDRAIRFLVPLFFVSGATSLVYQSLWARQLNLVFGTSQLAISTTLAAFMAGLALGGFGAARVADRTRRPLATYGVLEVVIGVWALLLPTLLSAGTPLVLAFHRTADPSPPAFAFAQFVLVAALLLVPTTCMGATLPLLARFAAVRTGDAGDRVGLLYGVNTLGAVFGVALAGFWLLPLLGLWATTVAAAAANLLLGGAAVLLSRHLREHELLASPAPPDDEAILPRAPEGPRTAPRAPLLPLAAVAALAGLASLIYEVAWFRLMGLVLGGSTYAFSTMLLAFLLGIGLGGRLGGPWADRARARSGATGPLFGLALLQVGVAALTWGLLFASHELPFLFTWMFDLAGGEVRALFWGQVALAVTVLVPPALLMGATFPFLVRAAVGPADALGAPVGRLYGANTLGAIVGSFLAGFVLLPGLRVVGTMAVAGGANLVAAVVAWSLGRRLAGLPWRLHAAGGLAAAGATVTLAFAAPPPWNPLLMTAGMYKYASDLEDHSRAAILDYAVHNYHLLFYEEGLSSVVTVAQSRTTGNIWLANNGKVDASTTSDMPTQVLVSQLPFAFGRSPRQVAIIGLASGISAGSLTLQEGVEHIDIVELEPAIARASRFFEDYNHKPLQDPRARLVANDGRNHLLLTPPGTYDLIVSEPSNPWLSGVSNLFTREFFAMGAERLAPGGLWAQWVQLYGMGAADLGSLLATFHDVFPYVAVFATIEDADVVLVGSLTPLALTLEGAGALFATDALRRELAAVHVTTPHDVLARYLLGHDEIARLRAVADPPTTLNTDDNMRVEFNAPLNLHRNTGDENYLLLRPLTVVPPMPTAQDFIDLARAYERMGDPVKGVVAVQRGLEANPDDPVALALRERLARLVEKRWEEEGRP